MLKRNLLAVAVASVLIGVMSAHAADQVKDQTDTSTPAQDTSELGVIKVTGIRHAIETAIETKQQSTSIVEAVSAEDIGKLPDISIAESIARLPGLSAQRVAGRAQVISVRGLSPDFATTLLNGRELVSTGDNRSVEFDQYPSELISGVTVYKTPDAGLVGQGLSGTIDMQTVRPLNFNNPVVVLGARGQHDSLGSAANEDANGNRINASYIAQFADHTFGVALGFAHTDTPVQEDQVGLYEPWEQVGEGWRPGVPAGTWYSEGIKALRRTGYDRRNGVMATLEWKPSDAWTSTLDLFHTSAMHEDTANQFEVNLGDYNGGYGHIAVTNPVINGNGTFIGGTAANLYPLVRGMYDRRTDKIDAFGWKNEFKAGIATIVADVSYSKAKRNELSLENNTQLVPAPQLDTLTSRIRATVSRSCRRRWTTPTRASCSYAARSTAPATARCRGSAMSSRVSASRARSLRPTSAASCSRASISASTTPIATKRSTSPKRTSMSVHRATPRSRRTWNTVSSTSDSPAWVSSIHGTCRLRSRAT
jgi:TonB-dependent receptor